MALEVAAMAPEEKSDHELNDTFCIWFRTENVTGSTAEAYEKSIKPVASFRTVEAFWRVYSYLRRPSEVTAAGVAEMHCFRDGIKPIWEDRANQRGGKLMARLPKGLASRFWEGLLLVLVGEQFEASDDIAGVVISMRPNEDIIAVWNKNADNPTAIAKIRETLKQELELPSFVRLEYKRHDKRLRARGSSPPESARGGNPGWRE